jgi:hypothetical protein
LLSIPSSSEYTVSTGQVSVTGNNSGTSSEFDMKSTLKNGNKALGIGAEIAELRLVSNGQWYSQSQGRWYNMNFYGNQYTERQAGVLSKAHYFKVFARGSFVVGTFIGGVTGYKAYKAGDYSGAAKSGVDIGMGAVSTFGGPYGLA